MSPWWLAAVWPPGPPSVLADGTNLERWFPSSQIVANTLMLMFSLT